MSDLCGIRGDKSVRGIFLFVGVGFVSFFVGANVSCGTRGEWKQELPTFGFDVTTEFLKMKLCWVWARHSSCTPNITKLSRTVKHYNLLFSKIGRQLTYSSIIGNSWKQSNIFNWLFGEVEKLLSSSQNIGKFLNTVTIL